MDTNRLVALLPDIAAFVTVVESGSFTAAANAMGMTPSGVSRQVSRLETALNVDLLERTTRRQVMTEVGKAVYELSVKMMVSAHEIASITDLEKAEAIGEIRVAAPKAFSKQVLEPLLVPFLKRFPKTKLKVMVTDSYVDPIRDEIDVFFELTHTPRENLVAKKLGHIRSVLCASKDYLQSNGIPFSPSDLTEHQCLFLGERVDDNVWTFTKGSTVVKVKVDGRYSVNHSEMRLDAVKQGMGIGVFPDFVVKDSLLNAKVIEVLPEWQLKAAYQGEVIMQYPQTKYMPARRRVFIDYMVKAFSER